MASVLLNVCSAVISDGMILTCLWCLIMVYHSLYVIVQCSAFDIMLNVLVGNPGSYSYSTMKATDWPWVSCLTLTGGEKHCHPKQNYTFLSQLTSVNLEGCMVTLHCKMLFRAVWRKGIINTVEVIFGIR